LWCFVVWVRDLVESLEETPRETQVAPKNFFLANAFLFIKNLLDTPVPNHILPSILLGDMSAAGKMFSTIPWVSERTHLP